MLTLLLVGSAVLCAVRWKAWFSNPVEPIWTADTLSMTLHTFAEATPVDTSSYAILILGDVHSSMQRADFDTLSMRHSEVMAYAQLGDLLDRDYFYYRQQFLHAIDSTMFRTLPIINCPGNHEYRKGLNRFLPDSWYELFPQPLNGPRDFLGSSYYIDFPYMRYIVLDTNGLRRLRDFTRVVTWLRQTMSDSGDRFTVVMMHHPVFSSAKGRFNPGVFSFFVRALFHADLVFAGHDHNYARRLPFINLSSYKDRTRPVSVPFFGMLPWQQSASGTFYAILSVTSMPEPILTLRIFDYSSGIVVDSVTITASR